MAAAKSPRDAKVAANPAESVLAERLFGTWRVLSVVTVDQTSGAEHKPFGATPEGYLIYTREGHVMTMLAAAGRTSLPVERRPSETELAIAFMSAAGYAGRYSVKEDHIIHHIEVCTLPNWAGVTQIRHLAMDGDMLILSTPTLDTPAIGEVRWTMVWGRAE